MTPQTPQKKHDHPKLGIWSCSWIQASL